jgi:hypothetical protein
LHLHGFAFYAVGRGFGNFDESTDPATYNLVDPPRQNTVSVPAGGWAAIRFRATNPGENLLVLLGCKLIVYYIWCFMRSFFY